MNTYSYQVTTTLDQIKYPIIISTYRRSGTHLMIDLIRKQFKEYQSWKYLFEPLSNLYLEISDPLIIKSHTEIVSQEKALKILQRAERPIIKTHDLPGFKTWLQRYPHWESFLTQKTKIFYIVRNPLKVLCSLHIFMQIRHPETRCDISDFIRQETKGISRVKEWSNHVESWLNYPNVVLFKTEDVCSETKTILDKIGHELSVKPLYIEPLLPAQCKNIWQHRWLRLTSIRPYSTSFLGRYLGQEPQNYLTAFSPDDIFFIKQEAGEIIEKLGYSIG
ncbi:MAG: sulfotransferase domain-containing protein [Cyanobacteria bacterium]|nr:sulfotransferase domain-containing protein [Cyanobacteria bacterium CG_2015-16_32_12]NCO78586.1 sulfotransferase domain-containing protein [Cyanobacteria bacterium CG_2015-22_32_23]NCQ02978.1 sulfotransferase domain-containing protein [Cyanobacteria bacterium CG_2015-09_32_10]NCQ41160.1 sulfotransferase domain-containing protein [Cyanobacteria bacterium CG_2015-04_32_10]NCS83669.1 sulfotransferase domain-containing protein [Cyanobacteria bacterium CG_2015-02_32_10]